MAWAAMIAMIIGTIILFTPIVTENRVNALSDLLGLFYISQAGIVGAYMGVTAWMSKKMTEVKTNYSNPIPPLVQKNNVEKQQIQEQEQKQTQQKNNTNKIDKLV